MRIDFTYKMCASPHMKDLKQELKKLCLKGAVFYILKSEDKPPCIFRSFNRENPIFRFCLYLPPCILAGRHVSFGHNDHKNLLKSKIVPEKFLYDE